MKMEIEKQVFDIFMQKFKCGKFGTQRLGQAFCNEFNLHRVSDQTTLHNLYAKDGEHALNLIKTLFTFK
jgi:hypothetical protein